MAFVGLPAEVDRRWIAWKARWMFDIASTRYRDFRGVEGMDGRSYVRTGATRQAPPESRPRTGKGVKTALERTKTALWRGRIERGLFGKGENGDRARRRRRAATTRSGGGGSGEK